jgi:chorismate lyase/3-hydroxybenzoate synthase
MILAPYQFGATPYPLAVFAPPFVGQEVWYSRTPTRSGKRGRIRWCANESVLFGQMHVPLLQVANDVEAAYREVLDLLAHWGYPHLWRTWNYLDRLLEGEGDAERYRQFVLGRFRAYEGHAVQKCLPAATVIGTQGAWSGLWLGFLAGKQAGVALENPRQTPASKYPRQYGPKSPSFSRAMRLTWQDREDVLVSGTASIVGADSVHVGDVGAQISEIQHNLGTLLKQAGNHVWQPAALRCYWTDLGHCTEWQDLWGAWPMLHWAGEVCRPELRVELEGVFSRALG